MKWQAYAYLVATPLAHHHHRARGMREGGGHPFGSRMAEIQAQEVVLNIGRTISQPVSERGARFTAALYLTKESHSTDALTKAH